MSKILLMGHGNFASGLKSVLDLVVGSDENILVCDFTQDKTPEIYKDEIIHLLKDTNNSVTNVSSSTEELAASMEEVAATIQEIAEVINRRIKEETTDRQGENGTDKLAKVLTNIPGPIIRLAVNTLMWMDRHNLLPKAIIDLSPFHTSFFITNLKSLGINHIYHHTYEFGTTGLFFAMGKEKVVPVIKGNEVVAQKEMGFGLVSDERFCDGLYFALSLRKLRRFMQNPASLEKPLDKKVEDVE